jgi:acetoacetate decarboxylase
LPANRVLEVILATQVIAGLALNLGQIIYEYLLASVAKYER